VTLQSEEKIGCEICRDSDRIGRAHGNHQIQIATCGRAGASEGVSATAQNTLMRPGWRVVDRPRALQKALRARENELRKLLASSRDGIVITDVGGRFIAANSKALDLFGVSETNIKKFTFNLFASHGQTPYFAGHSSAFIRREKRHGECRVRRLDGSLRVAEYAFVAHFLPNRHVCRFRNVRTGHITTFTSTQGNDSKSSRQRLEFRSGKI